MAPRVRGTGAGRYGIDVGTPIVGGWSGVTINGVTAPSEYREQALFSKVGTNQKGWQAMGYFDLVRDVAEMFSTQVLAAGAAVTNAFAAPGRGYGGGYAPFPAHAYLNVGTATSHGIEYVAESVYWYGCDTFILGQSFALAMEAIESQGQSADGSWASGYANLYGSGGGALQNETDWCGYQRLDNVDEGDVCPFVSLWGSYSGGFYSNTDTRTLAGQSANLRSSGSCGSDTFTSNYYGWLKSWYRRGQATGEAYVGCSPGVLAHVKDSGGSFTDKWMMRRLPQYPEVSDQGAVTKRTKEAVWVMRLDGTRKIRKGTFRWVSMVQGGMRFMLSEDKRWLQLACGYDSYQSDQAYPALLLGGWDGSTVQHAV